MISKKKYIRLQEELIRKEKEIVGLRKEIERLQEKIHREIEETATEQQKNSIYAAQLNQAYDLASTITQICGRRP